MEQVPVTRRSLRELERGQEAQADTRKTLTKARKAKEKTQKRIKASIIATVLASSLALAGVVAFNNLHSKLNTEDTSEYLVEEIRPTKVIKQAETLEDGFDGPLNILLIGSDSRAAMGEASAEGMRSDTTILAHISSDRKRVDLVSIPRDSLFEIPSCTLPDGSETAPQVAKFNAAFAYGGQTGDAGAAASCTIKTFERLADIYVDGFMVIDFSGFEKVVNDLGGVEFNVPNDVVDPDFENLVIKAGTQTFDGKEALQYARVRKAVGMSGSDLSRIERQQELLSVIIQKAISKTTDIPTMYSLVGSLAEMTTTNEKFGDIKEISGLAWALKDIEKDSINFITVPTVDAGDGANLVWSDEAMALWTNIKQDYPVAIEEPIAEPIVEPGIAVTNTDPGAFPAVANELG